MVNMAFGQKRLVFPRSWGCAPGYGDEWPSAKTVPYQNTATSKSASVDTPVPRWRFGLLSDQATDDEFGTATDRNSLVQGLSGRASVWAGFGFVIHFPTAAYVSLALGCHQTTHPKP